MSATGNVLEFSLPSTEFEYQALMIIVLMILEKLFRHNAHFLFFPI